jgi:hypothetical protein
LADGFEHRYGLGPKNVFLPIVPAAIVLVLLLLAVAVAVRRGVIDVRTGVLRSSTGERSPDGGATEDAAADDPNRIPALDPDANVTLSDDEVVLQLLERNDGRMKQSEIVERTEWSKAKVSRTLSRMADEGKVQKLKLGRENLVTLEDEILDVPE